jgi:peroxiredoxin
MRAVVSSVLASLLLTASLASPSRAAVAIGEKLTPFALKNVATGEEAPLARLAGKKATVLIFLSTQCPISNSYNERMAALAREYSAKGVAFVGINSNRQETPEEIARHAQETGLTFPILKDVANERADALGARVTPEAYVYDPSWRLVYHGRIDDDRYGTKVKTQDLRAALDAVVASKPVAVSETKAFGCSIKRAATPRS